MSPLRWLETWSAWMRSAGAHSATIARRSKRSRAPGFVRLESRRLLSIRWDGEGPTDDWNDPTNWQSNTLPGAFDEAVMVGPVVPLSQLLAANGGNGSGGQVINGDFRFDESGTSLGSAGDINRDGYEDLIVGAPGVANQRGAAYVIFGKPGGLAPNFELTDLNGANGFKLSGVATSDRTGSSVSGTGDVNGDGFDDLLIGAPRADHGSGAAYLVFGHAGSFPANFNLSTIDGASGVKFTTGGFIDLPGTSVSGAGDMNGDGLTDIIVGAPGVDATGGNSGVAYLVYGSEGGFAANFNLTELNGTNGGVQLRGAPPIGASSTSGDSAGTSVSALGDVNGDGLDDVIVGAPFGQTSKGTAYVVFGKAGGLTGNLDLASLNGANGGFILNGVAVNDLAGNAVSGAGDINGDGFADLIVCNKRQIAYLVYGRPTGSTSNVNLAALDGLVGSKLTLLTRPDAFEMQASGAGDVNADGFDDLIVGAGKVPAGAANPNGNLEASAYLVFGKAGGFGANLELSTLDGANGFRLAGAAADDMTGNFVAAAGNFNEDLFDDVLIGAVGTNNRRGASYLFLGQNFTGAAIMNQPPQFTSSATPNVAENTTSVLTVSANDALQQTLRFRITGGADQAKFAIDAYTGELSFKTAPDFENKTDVGANNVYDVIVEVRDGRGGLATQSIAVTVTNVLEADLRVILGQPTNTVARGTNKNYTINFSNLGPNSSSSIVISANIPPNCQFVSSTLAPGTMSASQITWRPGSLAAGSAGVSITFTLRVGNVSPDLITCQATISSAAVDANSANNASAVTTRLTNPVGTFDVSAPARTREGASTRLSVSWTVPGASWNDLKSVDLRLRDGALTLFWVRFDEATRKFRLYDPVTRKFGASGTPGTSKTLSNLFSSLDLQNSGFFATGPDSPTVTLNVNFKLKLAAAGRTLKIEVAAANDFGREQDFATFGKLKVDRRGR